MTRYKNLGGDSGVIFYEIGPSSITVQFHDGKYDVYGYTCQSAGRDNIEEMKSLARRGQGLNGFINRRVRKKYESKRRSW